MNTTRIKGPEAVYQAAMRAITHYFSEGAGTPEELSKIFAPSVHFYGSFAGESGNNIDNLERLLEHEKYQLQKSGLTKLNNIEEVHHSHSSDGNSAVFVDNLQFCTQKGSSQPHNVQISVILHKIMGDWKVTHFHTSVPARLPKMAESQQSELQEKVVKLEKELREKTDTVDKNLEQLEENRKRLVQQEKLAGLGQLTAGIAHEIKNPLNFITNFSELSTEFISEIEETLEKLDQNDLIEDIKELLDDVKGNLQKIHQHGSRADSIVKSMLLHSRGGSGKMEDTDLNALLKEFVNLSFHGMRANKNPINVDIKVETDDKIKSARINPEDFSRVVLNLCKNAFDAMREKIRQEKESNYLPRLMVRSLVQDEKILVEFEDNGPGISEEVMKKMMQPFFTTKTGTEGTGLGLSISQDIIKNHNASLKVESRENEFTRFTIVLNNNQKNNSDENINS